MHKVFLFIRALFNTGGYKQKRLIKNALVVENPHLRFLLSSPLPHCPGSPRLPHYPSSPQPAPLPQFTANHLVLLLITHNANLSKYKGRCPPIHKAFLFIIALLNTGG